MKISPALSFLVCIVATAMADESSSSELLHGRMVKAGKASSAKAEKAAPELEVEGTPGRFLGKGGKGSKSYRLLTGLQDQAVSEGAEVEAEPEVEVEGTPGRLLGKGGKAAGKAARRLSGKGSKGTKRL